MTMTDPPRTRTRAALIPAENLRPSPHNVRTRLTNLEPLAASIRSVGILQTLLVVPVPGEDDQYRVIEGHRRRAAGNMAGVKAYPCMVREHSRVDETALMTIANLQREALDPMDAARAFAGLMKRHTTAEVAAMTGFSPATIRARVSLLELPSEAQALVSNKTLSLGDAQDLAKSVTTRRSGSARVSTRRRTGSHFTNTHPLAAHVQARCAHQDSDRRLLGGGCGQCWEAVIRADATGALSTLPPARTTEHSPATEPEETTPVPREYDESAVLRAVNGDLDGLTLATGDREEAVRRLVAQGLSDGAVASRLRLTGRTVLRIRGRLGLAPAIPPAAVATAS